MQEDSIEQTSCSILSSSEPIELTELVGLDVATEADSPGGEFSQSVGLKDLLLIS